MMTRVPRLTGAQLVVALGRAGFVVIRTKGSHNFYAISPQKPLPE